MIKRAWRHRTIDLRTDWAIDLMVADIDGDGRPDIVSGGRWYQAPDWEAFDLPGIAQAVAVHDVDGDGVPEIIGTRGPELTSRLCWAKRSRDGWTCHDIGVGGGDFPHGVAFLDDRDIGRMMITTYHGRGLHPPQAWRIPDDPTEPWPVSDLIDLDYSEEVVVADLDGDGRPEIIAGPWWLEHVDGAWRAHRFADPTYQDVARVRVADLDGDGRLDIVLTEETGDWETRDPGLGRVAWFKQPQDLRAEPWTEQVVARMKCPHSLDVVDIDGDGRVAIIAAEHDAFTPEGQDVNARLSIFRRLDRSDEPARWAEEVVDTGFEHFDGAKAIDLSGTVGIVSHGYTEPRYLHLWEPTGVPEGR